MPSQLGRRSRSVDLQSPPMRQVGTLVEAAASHACTVLIQGESGTGKELIARQIHDASDRAEGPFVAVDCAAFSDSLFESQVFGHIKGAFTGAENDTLGFFRAADGGTLLLDEVGELDSGHQAKLLRSLQESAVVPVGDVDPIPIDVRIVAASLRTLKQMVQSGKFREDLYFRLAVMCIEIPPLRERAEDVLPLAHHYLDALAEFYGEEHKRLTTDAEQLILTFAWPGNVRQLANAMEHAFILAKDVHIEVEHLPVDVRDSLTSKDVNATRTLAAIERDAVLRALHEADYVKKRAAASLGIDPRRLNRMIARLGIDASVERSN